ncbi:MAG: hypothetical protein AMXMBFR13_42290 [Phycisphaerae bacterium]
MSLIDVRVGDKVVVCKTDGRAIAEVVRVTPDSIYCRGGIRYIRSSGRRWGQYSELIVAATPAFLAEVCEEVAARQRREQEARDQIEAPMRPLCYLCGRPCQPGQDLIQGIAVRMRADGVLIPRDDAGDDLTVHRACIDGKRQPDAAKRSVRSGVSVGRADVLGFLE